jgi:uncharacterized membrane protein
MLLAYLRQSLLIWFFTNLKGTVILWIILPGEIAFHQLMIVSLIFSLPAVVLLLPALYILDFIDGPPKRIAFALISTLSICAVVLMLFLAIVPGFGDHSAVIGRMLLPYVGAAPICFIVVAEVSAVRKIKS